MLTAIIEGLPAGLAITAEDINAELARRQQGYGSGGRMSIERDEVHITAGVMNGVTTGAPVALLVENRDYKNWKEKDIAPMTTPRPGHADLTGAIKYGYRDLRVALERASARETTMRVALGAICKKLLAEYSTGTINFGGLLRLAFSATPTPKIPPVVRKRVPRRQGFGRLIPSKSARSSSLCLFWLLQLYWL